MATALVGIRPNPFNPSAEISFDLATPGSVRVAVYDLRGVLVRTLAETSLGVGRHEVTWDGRGMQGEPVASGVYFIRLQAPGVSQTMKAMLAK
jgi:flagellar hook assembly protein FlgD